jgi:hypothetical protein
MEGCWFLDPSKRQHRSDSTRILSAFIQNIEAPSSLFWLSKKLLDKIDNRGASQLALVVS